MVTDQNIQNTELINLISQAVKILFRVLKCMLIRIMKEIAGEEKLGFRKGGEPEVPLAINDA